MSSSNTSRRDQVREALAAKPGQTVKELAGSLGLPVGTASSVTSKMESEGLLTKVGRPGRYSLALPGQDAYSLTRKRLGLAGDISARTPAPAKIAQAWNLVFGTNLSARDVQVALGIAHRMMQGDKE